MLFDSGSVWIPIIMHVLVGLLSLAALAVLTRSNFSTNSAPRPQNTRAGGSAKNSNGRRTRRRRGDSKLTEDEETPGTIYGLVNTGNTCFLNSVLQALASSSYLMNYLESSPIVTRKLDQVELGLDPEEFPVTIALAQTVGVLNMVVKQQAAAYPTEVVRALRDRMRLTTYEQQDAQEFFQILSDALHEEEAIVVHQGRRSAPLLDPETIRGLVSEQSFPGRLGGWPSVLGQASAPNGRRNPLNGLLASRLACVQCGYIAAIRHFSFNNISLSLPFRASCTLEECLLSYITIESLQDVVCRKCSLNSTLIKAEKEKAVVKNEEPHHPRRKSKSKGRPKKEASPTSPSQAAKKIEELRHALEFDVEKELGPNIPLERVVSRHCTKQVMFAKPPQVLCLHLNRSAYFPNGAISKNPCRVQFPEVLDLTPFCTTGHLVLGPQSPLSSPEHSHQHHRYRLQAVIVHYGSHSYGHFVTFRRKPLPSSLRPKEFGCFNSSSTEWFQVSDQSVLPADPIDVLSANPYMLLYEIIPTQPKQPPPQLKSVPPFVTTSTTPQPVTASPPEPEDLPSPSPSTSSPGPPTPAEMTVPQPLLLGEVDSPHLSSSSQHNLYEERTTPTAEINLVD